MLPDWVTLTTDRAGETWTEKALTIATVAMLGIVALGLLTMLGVLGFWILSGI